MVPVGFTDSQNELVVKHFKTDLMKNPSSGFIDPTSKNAKYQGQLMKYTDESERLIEQAQRINMYQALKKRCEKNEKEKDKIQN